jgi:hypothetical protein
VPSRHVGRTAHEETSQVGRYIDGKRVEAMVRAGLAGALLACAGLAQAQVTLSCQAVYAVSTTAGVGNLRSLVSPYTTATSTVLASSPALAGVNGMGFNATQLQRLYYLNPSVPATSPASYVLYYADLSTPTPTFGHVASPSMTVPTGAADTLAFSSSGVAHAYDSATGILYRSGGLPALTYTSLVGGTPPSTAVTSYSASDIVVDAAGDVYMVGIYPASGPAVSAHLLKLDPQTGVASYLRPLVMPPAVAVPSQSSGLAWAEDSIDSSPVLVLTGSSGTFEVSLDSGVAVRPTSQSWGDLASCADTLVSRRLALAKTWVAAPAGDAVGLAVSGAGVFGAVAGQSVQGGAATAATASVRPGTSVGLNETFTTGSAANYHSELRCVKTSDGSLLATSLNLLTMPSDSDVACTITNSLLPRLTLRKQVQDLPDAAAPSPAAWTLSATGPQTVSGASGSAAVTSVAVPVGSYVLGESGGVAGYSAGAWVCSGGRLQGGELALAAGDMAVCELTNTRTTAALHITKAVVGAAAAQPWQFTLRAITAGCLASAQTQASADGGSGNVVFAGLPTHTTAGQPCDYSVEELALAGYVATPASTQTVRLHEQTQLNFTNTRVTGALQVLKSVEGGASMQPWQFTVTSADRDCLATSRTQPTPDGSGGVAVFADLPTHNLQGQACAYQVEEQAQAGWRMDVERSDVLTGRRVGDTVAVINVRNAAPVAVPWTSAPLAWVLLAGLSIGLVAGSRLRSRRTARVAER